MRRLAALALVIVVTLAAVTVAALSRYRLRGLKEVGAVRIPKPVNGMFANGMAYARWGTGPKTLLLIPGGPGNVVPTGMALTMYLRALRPLVENGYTAWFVVRRQNMPRGHTIEDMADDYAQLITDEFDGRVDVVLGTSYGGIVGLCLAARHPDRFGHIAIAVAGYQVSERGKTFDFDFAKRLSEGKTVEASTAMFEFTYPSWRLPGVARVFGALIGRFAYRDTHPYFENDVMVEAEAEVAFNAREILPDISVPVLLVGGDQDVYFPKEVCEETARLIPDCTLKIYEGKGHIQAASDPRLPRDVLDFVVAARA